MSGNIKSSISNLAVES
jgi:hypothetical protein